jgi:hypothetical protein
VWHLHTAADVRLTKKGATLTLNGKTVELRIDSPADASFTAEPDVARPPQQPVEGITHLRLAVTVKDKADIVVTFEPVEVQRR